MFNSIFGKFTNVSFFQERLLSLFIYMGVLLIICFIIRRCKSCKSLKIILILYLLILSIMGYFFIPAQAHDLSRLFIDMHNYDNYSINTFIPILLKSIRYSRDLLYFIVAKSHLDGLLPLSAVLISYSCIFYILYDYSKENEISMKSVARALFFIMLASNFGDTISGIRSMCAFSICAYCIYSELYKTKSFVNDLLLYFIAIGFHSVSIPIILIRTMFLLIQKEKKVISRFFNIAILIIIIFIGLRYGNIIIEEALNKGTDYMANSDGFSWLFWGKMDSLIGMIIVSTVLLIIKKYEKSPLIEKCNIKKSNYHIMTIILYLTIVLFYFVEDNVFYRFSSYMFFTISLPYMLSYFELTTAKKSINHITKYDFIYYPLILILSVIQLSRGSLCGIKFFIFK